MATTNKKYKYFTPKEVRGLHPELVTLLDTARGLAKTPFVITDGLRKKKAGYGVSNSAHHKGLAVDLRCRSSRPRFLMLKALIAVGFRRIGIYDRHIHVDISKSKDRDVAWWAKSK